MKTKTYRFRGGRVMEKDLAEAIIEAIERVARSMEAVESQLMETNGLLRRGVSVDITSMPPKKER